MVNELNQNQTMDFPQDFRCPISMELMEDPVTISTGVTYERKSIERWLHKYKKMTCPTTMQPLHDLNLTPNHTLKRLIFSWNRDKLHESSLPVKNEELVELLDTIESTPFKVNSLKKLRSMVEMGGNEMNVNFQRAKGIEVLLKIVCEILVESSDFVAFRACEEAINVLHIVITSSNGPDTIIKLLSIREVVKSMAMVLQKGSSEARFQSLFILQKMAKADFDWNLVIQDQGIDLFKSLLEIISDDMCTKASSCTMEVLIDIINSSKKSRLKAVEAGAVCVLIELLPDSSKSNSERIMYLIKQLCECADGRLAFVEHKLGIAAISKKMSHVFDGATKIGVRILCLVLCSFHPSDQVIEEMLLFGAVKKLVALLHVDGRSATKDKVAKILKLHLNSWRRYPCFPNEFKDYLGLMGDSL